MRAAMAIDWIAREKERPGNSINTFKERGVEGAWVACLAFLEIYL